MVAHLKGGVHYPRSTGEFQSWFATDADCLDYLDWLRWPQGFVCPRCQNPGGWRVADGRYKCACCAKRTAVTAGTLFDRRRTPLTVWFAVCWQFATANDGASTQCLRRTLEFGSYQTAWAMLHLLRSVLVRFGRDRFTDTVEVDATYYGDEEPGSRCSRHKGKKILVGVAVELQAFGRCRIAVLTDASVVSRERFVTGTSKRDRRSSPMPGRAIRQPSETATSTSRSTSSAAGSPRTSCSRMCTAPLHSPSGGSRAIIKIALARLICRITSTSGSSVSITDPRRAEGSSSTDCSSSPSTTIRCATDSSLPTQSRRRCRRGDGGIRRPSSGLTQNTPGDRPPDQEQSAQMDIP